MHSSHLHISFAARPVMAATWAIVCLCIVSAPILASHSWETTGSILYLLFSQVCHQIPERSFHLFGFSLAVCHRCAGVYGGMMIGCFADLHRMHRNMRNRRLCVLGAVAPLGLDALAPFAGLWTSNAISRFSTGLLFGTLISSLVVQGFAEFMDDAPWRRLSLHFPQPKGDIS